MFFLILGHHLLYLVTAVFLLFFFTQFILISDGNVLNNYPAMSSDGYDWLTEGLYLKLLLKDAVAEQVLPVLRPPVFVLVTMLDAFAGQGGYVIAAANTLAWGATIICVYRLMDPSASSDIRDGHKYLIGMLVVGLLTVAPINYFRIFLLSDGLCIGLAMASYYFFHRYLAGKTSFVLVMATILGVLAASTQTYGLIPPLIASAVGMVTLLRLGEFHRLARLIVAVGLLVAGTFSLRLLWLGAFKHDMTPKNFDLLQFSFSMTDFYLSTWSIYLLPLLPVLAVSIFYAARLLPVLRDDLVFLSAAMVTGIFAVLCFFYQWPDARFTLLFWPWLVVAAGKLLLGLTRAGLPSRSHRALALVAAALLFLQTFGVYPQNYWQPKWSQTTGGLRESWPAVFAQAQPLDRLQLRVYCGSREHVCAAAHRPEGLDPYATRVTDLYLALTAEGAAGPAGRRAVAP
jgi:hypothetical protein